jgi:hypothetical protein
VRVSQRSAPASSSSKAVTQSMGVDVLAIETGALRRVAGI